MTRSGVSPAGPESAMCTTASPRVDQGRLGAADDDAGAVGVHQAHPLAEGVEEAAEPLAVADLLAQVHLEVQDAGAARAHPAAAAALDARLGGSARRPGRSCRARPAPGVRRRRPRRSPSRRTARPRRPRRAAPWRPARARRGAASRRGSWRAASPGRRTPRPARGCRGRRGRRGSAAGWCAGRSRCAGRCRPRTWRRPRSSSGARSGSASEPRAEPGNDRLRSRRSGR